MRKLLANISDVTLCWIPFVAATYLCNSTLDHFAPGDFRYWEPAFYSFLPLSFFLMGAAVFVGRRELRDLRAAVAELREAASSKDVIGTS